MCLRPECDVNYGQLRQKLTDNSTSRVYISRRPNNIAKQSRYFAAGEISPNPGAVNPNPSPILLIQAATLANEVIKSYPIRLRHQIKKQVQIT